MKIKLYKTQVMEDILESSNTKKTDEWAGKHDYHYESYVTKIEDKYYEFTLEYSYNDGCITFDYQDYIEAVEVRPVEVKRIEWEVVKELEK